MIDFLKDYDISNEVIVKINKENSSANIYNLNSNQEEVVNIIKYFRKLGVMCIDELLIYRIGLFFNSLDDIKKILSKYDVQTLVTALNNDYNVISEIIS